MLSLAKQALASGEGRSMWADWVLTIFLVVVAGGFGIDGFSRR